MVKYLAYPIVILVKDIQGHSVERIETIVDIELEIAKVSIMDRIEHMKKYGDGG